MDNYSQSPEATTQADEAVKDDLLEFESKYKRLSTEQLAEEAMNMAYRQLMTSSDFKKPRMARLARYWELYDGHVPKKLRQLFNVPIPVFPGMVDTLNAQYEVATQLTFKEGDPADYFKVQKINGAFKMEVMDTSENSKWDSKLRMVRKHAILNGVGIARYTAASNPKYISSLDVTNLKHFHFQPRGGLYLENHLFTGEENIEKTAHDLIVGAQNGDYNKKQVSLLLQRCSSSDYLPDGSTEIAEKLSRFRPLGLNPDSNNYVGMAVYKLAQFIVEIDGKRWLILFHPWTKTWLRFEPWKDIASSEYFPWVSYATHEDDENFLSKSFGDDLYPAADAIVAMFNQELTNREKRNFGARAYDKDMFQDLKKLDEAMHRPDALVPADTKGGARRISEGIYEFSVGELGGTVNLIDWITGTLGRNTGANDLAQGSVQEVSKKASVTFAEQKSVSKRLSWASQPFQQMMAQLGKRYLYGLKDHMPSKMAIRMMGEKGLDWDHITRLDLDTTKDVDVLIISSDDQAQKNELQKEKRIKALSMLDPAAVNPKKRTEAILKDIGDYEDQEIAEFLDVQTFFDKKALAKAAESIQFILQGKEPEIWYGANTAFMQKIVNFAMDNRSTLGDKFDVLMQYQNAHAEIAMQNAMRKAADVTRNAGAPMGGAPAAPGAPMPSNNTSAAPAPDQESTSSSPGVQHAMNMANSIS